MLLKVCFCCFNGSSNNIIWYFSALLLFCLLDVCRDVKLRCDDDGRNGFFGVCGTGTCNNAFYYCMTEIAVSTAFHHTVI